MKDELKTLKDLKEKHGIFGPDYVGLKELKAEAVKWVKSRREQLNLENIGFEDGIIKWIKHFFNLTEEDLKEKTNKQLFKFNLLY